MELTTTDSCITLQPNAQTGKDAMITSLSPNNNYGTDLDFDALAWTNSSNLVNFRSLIDFDLTSIPLNATIVSGQGTRSIYTTTAAWVLNAS